MLCWLFSIVACATEPLDYTLPDPDFSLDPAALSKPAPMYACGSWINGPEPSEEKVFVDVSFDRGTESDPDDHPTDRHLAAVTRHGGEIVYKFHFPVARVWIKTNEIPALSKEAPVLLVFRIPNLRRYDWQAGAGFIKPYSYKQGATRYAQLGGRVDLVFDQFNSISGLIPDRSVSELRRDEHVDYVESSAPYQDPECK